MLGCSYKEGRFNQTNITISSQACLENINTDSLNESLQKCNEVIESYPKYPEVWNDRSLIYTLMGELDLACKDNQKALELLNNKQIIDPLISNEIKNRQNSCMQRRSIDGKD